MFNNDFISVDDTSIPCGPNIELQRKLQLQNEELECHCLSNDENVIGIAGKSVHLFNPQLNSININEINLNYVPKSITITCHDNSQSSKVSPDNNYYFAITLKAYM